jgi:oligoribonuclease
MPISEGAPRRDHLVWLDMEMTGLDVDTCVPLQVAMVVTSSELTELDALELTIWQPDAALATIEPFVRRMHTDNGLLEAVRHSELGIREAEQGMLSLITRWCGYRQAILAGNSIHTDRTFLARYFPVFEGYLHYRMVDVSSLKELVRRWYGPDALYSKPSGKHTALSDIRESIDELRHYRAQVMKPAG